MCYIFCFFSLSKTHSRVAIGFQGVYGETSRREKPRGRNHGLTQQKRQEIKEAFELFDTDGSGMALSH